MPRYLSPEWVESFDAALSANTGLFAMVNGPTEVVEESRPFSAVTWK